jgi:hypothetical protein
MGASSNVRAEAQSAAQAAHRGVTGPPSAALFCRPSHAIGIASPLFKDVEKFTERRNPGLASTSKMCNDIPNANWPSRVLRMEAWSEFPMKIICNIVPDL